MQLLLKPVAGRHERRLFRSRVSVADNRLTTFPEQPLLGTRLGDLALIDRLWQLSIRGNSGLAVTNF